MCCNNDFAEPRAMSGDLIDGSIEMRRTDVEAARRVALQLSGHTHGGMFLEGGIGWSRVPMPGSSRAPAGLAALTLYVSNGAALWPRFALRLGPSALTLFTLHCSASSG